MAGEIARAGRLPGVVALQVDFDATTSERSFYRKLLAQLRQQLPSSMPISITALTSWCIGDQWMSGLPIDEAVPMLFRMGTGQAEVTNWMRSGHDFREATCRTSLGVSLDEPWPELPSGRRTYAFSPSPWTERSLQKLLREMQMMAMNPGVSRRARWWFIAGVAMVVLSAPAIYGCGPWFDEAVFIPGGAPQTSQSEFASGKLGIVLPSMRRSYLIVAYRYLNGMKLTMEQQHDAMDVWNRNMGPTPPPFAEEHPVSEEWLKARERVGVARLETVAVYAPVVKEQPYQVFLNCPADAFRTAERTLEALGAKYGGGSTAMKEWVAAQDQVFASCDGTALGIPGTLESKDPLLRAYRDYQIAAALFYQRRFDEAASAFEAIAKNPASPLAGYGEYLAARAMVREATLSTADYGKVDKDRSASGAGEAGGCAARSKDGGVARGRATVARLCSFSYGTGEASRGIGANDGEGGSGAGFQAASLGLRAAGIAGRAGRGLERLDQDVLYGSNLRASAGSVSPCSAGGRQTCDGAMARREVCGMADCGSGSC